IALAAAFFFVELVVAPIWAAPMDIAPNYSGSASGMMNFGFGVAGIISPVVFGYLIDRSGSWTLPFAGSVCLLLLGAGLAFRMHPDRPFEPEEARRSPRDHGASVMSATGPNDRTVARTTTVDLPGYRPRSQQPRARLPPLMSSVVVH